MSRTEVNLKYLTKKWAPILDNSNAPSLGDHKRNVIAQLLENTEHAIKEERAHLQMITETPTNATGAPINNWDPILISLVRRAMPNLIAYDIASVQPMSGPTGLIFAMKSRYKDHEDRLQSTEALGLNEPKTDWSSSSLDGVTPTRKAGVHSGDSSSLPGESGTPAVDSDPFDGIADNFDFGRGMTTNEGEGLGTTGNHFNEMSFTIERATVTAKTRALKAEYTMELAQDLKAIHGLDAESELANMLSTEILAEINREMIRTINSRAKLGSQQSDINRKGVFDLDVDADGRWSVEKYKGLLVQLHREQNVIARETRRGKGNFILCSSDVAAALSATGMLSHAPVLEPNAALLPDIDDTGNTFVGVLTSGVKIYIDPYASVDYITVGYRGANPWDAGMFYAPYVPLQLVKAIGENSFQPKIGFKTRYGMIANPFAGTSLGNTAPFNDIGPPRSNEYFRITLVKSILGTGATGGTTAP
jgi:hypothetical protein